MSSIIAVASGKGGVGKTWLSITLAHLIARSGRRVLLVDGDIGLANVDVQLGLTPQKDIASALAGRHTLAEAVTRYEAGGFDILAGRSGSASLASLTLDRLKLFSAALTELQKDYDILLLDLGAGVEAQVRALAALASRCVVVITDEPTSLTDAYAFIKLMQNESKPPEMEVVVNQAATQKEGEGTFQALSRACVNFLNLSPRLLGVIRRDGKVKESIRRQTSLIARAPQSTAATDAAAIAIKLMQR
jgi:flagellar biosynthesis protein FlhG